MKSQIPKGNNTRPAKAKNITREIQRRKAKQSTNQENKGNQKPEKTWGDGTLRHRNRLGELTKRAGSTQIIFMGEVGIPGLKEGQTITKVGNMDKGRK